MRSDCTRKIHTTLFKLKKKKKNIARSRGPLIMKFFDSKDSSERTFLWTVMKQFFGRIFVN